MHTILISYSLTGCVDRSDAHTVLYIGFFTLF